MKSHDSVWVVRMWCRIHNDPILRCFVNPEGLSCGDLLVSVVLVTPKKNKIKV
jgi:hypothetical protein